MGSPLGLSFSTQHTATPEVHFLLRCFITDIILRPDFGCLQDFRSLRAKHFLFPRSDALCGFLTGRRASHLAFRRRASERENKCRLSLPAHFLGRVLSQNSPSSTSISESVTHNSKGNLPKATGRPGPPGILPTNALSGPSDT